MHNLIEAIDNQASPLTDPPKVFLSKLNEWTKKEKTHSVWRIVRLNSDDVV